MFRQLLRMYAWVILALSGPTACGEDGTIEWIRSPWFDEVFATYATSETRIHVNSPPVANGAASQITRLIIYALPNGNTIEQTLGARLASGMDWQYDIQHVAAQVRLLRSIEQNERIVLVCAEAAGLSWPSWRRSRPNANERIAGMVESWRQQFGGNNGRITLTGHSGGGSFMLGYVEALDEIPDYVDRIAFLDANYAFDAELHSNKFSNWLSADNARRLIVVAYDDREITLDGKKVVSPTGGTFRATERMRRAFGRRFPLRSVTSPPFEKTIGLGGRLHFLVHQNPENRILHTALVGEMNGLLHVQTLGTRHEHTWGKFGGPRAYDKWIQPEPSGTGRLPPRTVGAVAGAEFIRSLKGGDLDQRETAILHEITSGNFPEFLRHFQPVPINGMIRDKADQPARRITATLQVMPDYLAVGSNVDFVRMPMTPQTAQRIANRLGCVLPTRKIVDAIDEHAGLHLEPQPMTENREAPATFLEHHGTIEQQRAGKPLGLLTIGIKKDVILSSQIHTRPDRVAIYGWRQQDGKPIQPLTIVHSNRYVDYSHGVRLVLDEIQIEGVRAKISEILADPLRCGLVSDEGPIDPPSYPLP